jgi:AraC family transcriptional regulator
LKPETVGAGTRINDVGTTVAAGGLLSSGEFFGSVRGRAAAGGFSMVETRYRSGEDLPPHAHERAFVCLALEGSYGESYLRGRDVEYHPFTAVYHPPGERHVTRMGPCGGRVVNIEIDPAWLELRRAFGPLPAAQADLRGGPLVWLAARMHRELSDGEPVDAERLEWLGAELLGALAGDGEEGGSPAWLPRVLARLHDDVRPPGSARALAAEAGVHPIHLARVFRRKVGEPVAAYARRLRVQRACRLLSEPGRGLAEVALEAGFADQSHLTRDFRRVTGTTPARLRARLSRS